MSDYTIVCSPPNLGDFTRLREDTGLCPKAVEAARIGLRNTWFGVHVVYGGETVGMGRIIGDGGCFFQVVDSCTPTTSRQWAGQMNHGCTYEAF